MARKRRRINPQEMVFRAVSADNAWEVVVRTRKSGGYEVMSGRRSGGFWETLGRPSVHADRAKAIRAAQRVMKKLSRDVSAVWARKNRRGSVKKRRRSRWLRGNPTGGRFAFTFRKGGKQETIFIPSLKSGIGHAIWTKLHYSQGEIEAEDTKTGKKALFRPTIFKLTDDAVKRALRVKPEAKTVAKRVEDYRSGAIKLNKRGKRSLRAFLKKKFRLLKREGVKGKQRIARALDAARKAGFSIPKKNPLETREVAQLVREARRMSEEARRRWGFEPLEAAFFKGQSESTSRIASTTARSKKASKKAGKITRRITDRKPTFPDLRIGPPAVQEKLGPGWMLSRLRRNPNLTKREWKALGKLERRGTKAEARIHGVLRGGWIYKGKFWTYIHGHGIKSESLKKVRELKIHNPAQLLGVTTLANRKKKPKKKRPSKKRKAKKKRASSKKRKAPKKNRRPKKAKRVKRVCAYGKLPPALKKKYRRAALQAKRRYGYKTLDEVPIIWVRSPAPAPRGLVTHAPLHAVEYELEKKHERRSSWPTGKYRHLAGDNGSGKKKSRRQLVAIDPKTKEWLPVSPRGARPGYSTQRGLSG